MKISVKSIDIVIVQMMMNLKKIYDENSDILHQEGRGQVNVIVIGEKGSTKRSIYDHLDSVEGKMHINFYRQYDLLVINKLFKKMKTKL